MSASENLAKMGIELPPVATPVGSYVPAIRSGNLVITSGQLPLKDGELTVLGKVGGTGATIEHAADAAAVAVVNALAAASSVTGGVDNIQRVIRLGVFVNSAPGFFDQAQVANGASDLLVKVFGDAGKHARAAVGVAELPLNAAVELELTVEVAG